MLCQDEFNAYILTEVLSYSLPSIVLEGDVYLTFHSLDRILQR
mgnify:CR=1 FL=1